MLKNYVNSLHKLNLPKTDKEGVPYLSYSQISTWKRSKRDYMRQYFFGERFEGNAYTEFGSLVGEALENNDYKPFTKEEQTFLKELPRYEQFEREIRWELDGFFIKGYIDTNSLENTKQGELVEKLADYKTGDIVSKSPEYESDNYTQLDIYAGAIEQETGTLPTDVKVVLIGRKGNAFKREKLTLNGEYAIIEKVVTPERVEQVKAECQAVAEEISSYYTTFLKLMGNE